MEICHYHSRTKHCTTNQLVSLPLDWLESPSLLCDESRRSKSYRNSSEWESADSDPTNSELGPMAKINPKLCWNCCNWSDTIALSISTIKKLILKLSVGSCNESSSASYENSQRRCLRLQDTFRLDSIVSSYPANVLAVTRELSIPVRLKSF